jgi:glycosyltransferase involved in cell wall biosynthesis
MHIALGYRWFLTSAGFHIERALQAQGHTVSYVGLPCPDRSGYDNSVSIGEIIQQLPQRPDLYLWIDPAGRYFPPGIEDLPLPTACYVIDVHLGHWRQQAARFFDAVFIAQHDYLDSFKRAVGHDQVYWLPLAAADDVHHPIDLPRIYDVGFVGNLALAHRNTPRAQRLKLIADRFQTNDFYRSYTPAEVAQVYSQSKIVFNTSINGDVTMRLFEGAACGAMVLTDSTSNGLGELFGIDREIVVYQNDADLIDKITYYLTQADERIAIARAGYDRVQAQHTYQHRVQKILEPIGQENFKRSAAMRSAGSNERLSTRREVYTHMHMLDAILDEARAAGHHPIRRAWEALPCLIRRVML